jgi:hypothetical protein
MDTMYQTFSGLSVFRVEELGGFTEENAGDLHHPHVITRLTG